MFFVLKSAISRQAKAIKLSLVLWLDEIVEFHSTFPTLGRVSKLSLLSLIGNVGFHPTFSALGKASELSLLSLIENVELRSTFSALGRASELSLLSLIENVQNALALRLSPAFSSRPNMIFMFWTA